ncbi:holliday junction resolvase [Bacillus phage YungSlug]|nr:holliday junction resolvase [Bacillus phage YungSlug]
MSKEKKTEQPKKKRKNSRAKGSKFERDIAKALTDWWGEEFHRVPASGGLRWGKDNRVVGDIVPPPNSDFPFSIECKKHEGWDLSYILRNMGEFPNWWAQCTRDAYKVDKIPLLIFSKNRSPIYFMMPHTNFIGLKGYPLRYSTTQVTVILDKEKDLLQTHTVCVGHFDDLVNFFPKDKILEYLS